MKQLRKKESVVFGEGLIVMFNFQLHVEIKELISVDISKVSHIMPSVKQHTHTRKHTQTHAHTSSYFPKHKDSFRSLLFPLL